MSEQIDLHSFRTRLGWTQAQMADELGLDRSTVSRIETGQQRPSGPVIRLLGRLMQQYPSVSSPDGARPSSSTAASPAGLHDDATSVGTLSPKHDEVSA
jgi:transcriptional regulator with XRE-family HTH domain